jgi:predicted O-methyltransferase YrrM
MPSTPEVRQLLRVLCAGRRCVEVGTGEGAGAAAIAETAATLVTIEIDPVRAAAAEERLRRYEHVRVLAGDWRDCLSTHAPFDFMFLDGPAWPRHPDQLEALIDSLEPGGLLLVDDLAPKEVDPDPARDLLLRHPRLVAALMLSSPSAGVVLAARRPSQ